MHRFSTLFYMEAKFGDLRQKDKERLTSRFNFLEEQRNRHFLATKGKKSFGRVESRTSRLETKKITDYNT